MSTTTVTYTPDPDYILAKATKLAAAMQAQAPAERPTTPHSLRFDSSSARRPSTSSEKTAPKSPRSPFRSFRDKTSAPQVPRRSNTAETTHTLHPPPPELTRAVTAPSSESANHRLGNGLVKTKSQETWPLRKSTDEPRSPEASTRTLKDPPVPILTHEDILHANAAREHTIDDTSPLPTTPRLRNSTYMPDHRKLKWAHPESGKLKGRPVPNFAMRGTVPEAEPALNAALPSKTTPQPFTPSPSYLLPVSRLTPTAVPISAPTAALPVPTESFDFELRDSVKSSTTYVSSVNDISATERSSTITSRTSASELLSPQHGAFPRPSLEEEISVDDYIALYAQGFEDDPSSPSENPPPQIPNKPIVSSPLSPRREEKVPPVPMIAIPPSSKEAFPEMPKSTSELNERIVSPSTNDLSSQLSQPAADKAASRRPSTAPASSDTANVPIPPMPPFATSNGRVTSAQLLAGDLPGEPADLSLLEPPPDPNSDRYGFKKNNQYMSLQQYEAWDSQYRQYLDRRRQKWNELMRKHSLNTGRHPSEFPPRSDTVKRFIRKGIPPEWRGNAWFWYAGGPARLAQNKGLYKRLLERCEEYTQLGESDREHIERDLYRTFPDNDKFKRLKDDPSATRPASYVSTAGGSAISQMSAEAIQNYERPMIGALRRVLRAFAVHQPRIGYCQSLNFLAGQLLLFLNGDEEKAFHLLCILTNEHLPGTHGVALEGANVDIGVLMGTLKDREPQLWAKLDDRADGSTSSPISPNKSRQLPTVSLATTSWFMSCFVGSLPVEACCRVWDVLFYEGSKTLFRIALGIFRLGAEEIKRIRDPMEIFQVVQTLPRKMVDANALMEASFGKTLEGRGLLSSNTVKQRREERREVYATERRERQTLIRQRSGSAATEITLASVSDGTSVEREEPAEEKKRRPSLSRGASLKRLTRFKSRKGGGAPPVPGLPP